MVRRVVCGLVFSALVFVPLSVAARASLSATGVISGSGTNYTLTVKNTGSDAIHCLRLFAPQGVTVTSVQGPSGAITQAQGNSFGSIELQAALIAAGASGTWTFTTAAAYPTNGGGELHVSSDCRTDVISHASGPGEGPCQCENLKVVIVPKSLGIFGAGEINHFHLEFQVKWTLTCTAGVGGCTATLSLATAGGTLRPALTINCTARCGAKRIGFKTFKLISDKRYDAKHRKGKTLDVVATRTCGGGPETKTFTFVFDKYGQVDKKKSKLK